MTSTAYAFGHQQMVSQYFSLNPPAPEPQIPTLPELLFLPVDQIARWTIALRNLICATGLPDTADLDILKCMQVLEEWTEFVASETQRLFHHFHRNPGDYNHSEAYFRMLVLITALQRDIGLTYNPKAIGQYDFTNSADSFIHGLLTGNKQGTCTSMPVLYTAIARKLGYPVYLCLTSGHIFCRWQGTTGERFNIEASGRGLSTPPDDHYRTWPRPISAGDVKSGLFLRNLNPDEELAAFVATRGHCFEDRGLLRDAIVAYSHAHRLAPTDPHYTVFLMQAINKEIDARSDGKLPLNYRQSEENTCDHPDKPQIKRFVLKENYEKMIVRKGGVNSDNNANGRIAPS